MNSNFSFFENYYNYYDLEKKLDDFSNFYGSISSEIKNKSNSVFNSIYKNANQFKSEVRRKGKNFKAVLKQTKTSLHKGASTFEKNWVFINELRKLLKHTLVIASSNKAKLSAQLASPIAKLGLFSIVSFAISLKNLPHEVAKTIRCYEIGDLEGFLQQLYFLLFYLADLIESYIVGCQALQSFGLISVSSFLTDLLLPLALVQLLGFGLLNSYMAVRNALALYRINQAFQSHVTDGELKKKLDEMLSLTDKEKEKIHATFEKNKDKIKLKIHRNAHKKLKKEQKILTKKLIQAAEGEAKQQLSQRLSQLETEFNLLLEQEVSHKMTATLQGRVKKAEECKFNKLTRHTNGKVVALLGDLRHQLEHNPEEAAKKRPLVGRDVKVLLITEVSLNALSALMNTALLTALVTSTCFAVPYIGVACVAATRSLFVLGQFLVRNYLVDHFLKTTKSSAKG